jgi:putative membrane protein
MFSSLAAAAPCAVVAWGGGPWFGWWWFLIPLFWIGIFFLIFGLVGRRWRRAAVARGGYGWGPNGPHSGTRAAEQTLADRYANGDIDEKEYRARLEVLRANRGDGS